MCTLEQCQLGANLPEGYDPLDRVGLFLDLQNPAQCGGLSQAWELCYYGRGTTHPSLAVDLLVYRPFIIGYVLVSSKHVLRQATDLQPSGFHCETITLKVEEMFEVQVGDVIGACLRSDAGLYPIGVLGGMQANANLTGQLHIPVRNWVSCFLSDVEVIVGTMLEPVTETALHLSIFIDRSSKLYM